MLDTNLNQFKSVFAHKFFVAPADQNYFLARFARTYGMHEEFWWQSLQAIEKLLKAGLILNNVSVKNEFQHNIEKLWNKHSDTFGNCAVSTLSKPENLDVKFWSDTPLKSFISGVNRMGQPDSRYGLISYANSSDDIFKLDQLVFELRRRTIGLDWIVGKDWCDECLLDFNGQSYRDVIQQMPSHQIRETKIPNGKFETVGSNLEDIYYSWNFAFTRDPQDLKRPAPASVAPSLPGIGNSYLYQLWKDLNSTKITPLVRKKVSWLLEHVKIGEGSTDRDFRRFIEGAK